MDLPEPARTLWKRHREAIERIAAAPGAESRTMLGGGSVLAARWRHRESTDIDVLLPERDNVNDAREGGPLDLAAATGGRHEGSTRDRLEVVLDAGRLDVAAIKPQLPGLEERLAVEGRPQLVLASAQILRGKLYRTNRGVTRDAFDIVVAANEEPRALELAVNSLDGNETRIICHNLLTANDRMVENAKLTLTGVPPEHQHHLARVGDVAADAVWGHRYAQVCIRTTATRVTIETRAESGRLRAETYPAGDAEAMLTRSGIGSYLTANSTLQCGALARTLDGLNEAGWNGAAYDSLDAAPERRLDDARRAAGLGTHDTSRTKRIP